MNYADMMDRILPYVAGCPEDLAVQKLRDSAIEFCTETQCHITGMTVRFDGASAAPADMTMQVVDVVDAKVGGEQIRVLALNDPDIDELEDGEYALRFSDPNALYLIPSATAAAPVTVDILAIVAPGPDSTKVHDDLWRRHHEAVINGALSRLYEIPARAWSNPQLAGYHGGKFEAAKRKAMADAHRNHLKPARRLRVKPA